MRCMTDTSSVKIYIKLYLLFYYFTYIYMENQIILMVLYAVTIYATQTLILDVTMCICKFLEHNVFILKLSVR